MLNFINVAVIFCLSFVSDIFLHFREISFFPLVTDILHPPGELELAGKTREQLQDKSTVYIWKKICIEEITVKI